MKKFFLALTGAAVLATSLAIVPDVASARDHRPHWNRHHQVCRIVWKKRVVWRHHHQHVIRYRVRQCWWR